MTQASLVVPLWAFLWLDSSKIKFLFFLSVLIFVNFVKFRSNNRLQLQVQTQHTLKVGLNMVHNFASHAPLGRVGLQAGMAHCQVHLPLLKEWKLKLIQLPIQNLFLESEESINVKSTSRQLRHPKMDRHIGQVVNVTIPTKRHYLIYIMKEDNLLYTLVKQIMVSSHKSLTLLSNINCSSFIYFASVEQTMFSYHKQT